MIRRDRSSTMIHIFFSLLPRLQLLSLWRPSRFNWMLLIRLYMPIVVFRYRNYWSELSMIVSVPGEVKVETTKYCQTPVAVNLGQHWWCRKDSKRQAAISLSRHSQCNLNPIINLQTHIHRWRVMFWIQTRKSWDNGISTHQSTHISVPVGAIVACTSTRDCVLLQIVWVSIIHTSYFTVQSKTCLSSAKESSYLHARVITTTQLLKLSAIQQTLSFSLEQWSHWVVLASNAGP